MTVLQMNIRSVDTDILSGKGKEVIYTPSCNSAVLRVLWLTVQKTAVDFLKTGILSGAGIATDYGLDGRGLIPGRGMRYSLLHSVQTGPGATQPHIKWVPEGLSTAR
jgi:hypothetical protein